MNALSRFPAHILFFIAASCAMAGAHHAEATESASPVTSAIANTTTTTAATTKKIPTLTLSVGRHLIKAEIAADDATRQQGLMYRKQMPKNDGMLFVFPERGYHAMWMKNCFIPISVAYLDEAGKIISIHEMEPQTETPHQALGPARYALEMNGGWFARNNIKTGDTIKGIEKAPKPK